jgi:hypothetical protein
MISLAWKCRKCGIGNLYASGYEYAGYSCGHGRKVEEVKIPDCTAIPSNCGMCELMRKIFDNYPTEQDPGCDRAAARKDKVKSNGRVSERRR